MESIVALVKLAIFLALVTAGFFRGRRNERLHLAQLAEREQQLQGITTFATRYPQVTGAPQDPVLVSGSVVMAADSFKMFVAGLRKFVGGRFSAYENLVERGRREALLRMKAQAAAAGCSMIFNVRVETTNILGGSRGGAAAVEVLAYGTALAPGPADVRESTRRYLPGPELPVVEGFDLAKNRASRWILIALGIATLYAFLEMTVWCDYWYVDSAPWPGFVLVGLLFVGLAIHSMRRHAVPMAETVGLALLVGLAAPPLLFFPALRINAMTDFSEPVASVYVLQPDGRLLSDTPGDPELYFEEDGDYWKAQVTGSTHTFYLRRGLLGFWQMSREPYLSRLIDFDDQRQQKRQEAQTRRPADAPPPPADSPLPAPETAAPPAGSPAADGS